MKILFVTDSLALPRDKPEVVRFAETYPQLIKLEFPALDIQQLSIGGATISELHNAAKYYQSYNPDMVIIQSGIVDCAPRALSKFERMFWQRVPILGKWVIQWVTRNTLRLRETRNLTYTNARDFDKWLKRLNDIFPAAKKLHIAVMPGSEKYEEKLPGVCANIIHYNSIIAKNTESLIGEKSSIDWLMSDHHHLNTLGHQALATQLIPPIKSLYS